MQKQQYLIAGCGVSGQAAARLASSLNLSYSILDQKDSPELRHFITQLPHPPEQIFLGWTPDQALPCFSTAVISPGIRTDTALYSILEQHSPVIVPELEFALRFADCPVIAITGTNGKTTTTELTTQLLKGCGFHAQSAGNIGFGLSDAVMNVRQGHIDILVVEVSSFQLEHMKNFHPQAAALLNLASDHLDRHGSMEKYAQIKFSLMSDPETQAVFSRSLDPWRERFFPVGRPCTIFSSDPLDTQADFRLTHDGKILFHDKTVVDFQKLSLKGTHNAENIMAALALIRSLKGDEILFKREIMETLQAFRPDAHRLELFLEKDGIRYVNDSKATNPHAVNAALDAFPEHGRVLLLLGGLDKDMIFEEIQSHAAPVKQAFLFGRCKEKIRNALS